MNAKIAAIIIASLIILYFIKLLINRYYFISNGKHSDKNNTNKIVSNALSWITKYVERRDSKLVFMAIIIIFTVVGHKFGFDEARYKIDRMSKESIINNGKIQKKEKQIIAFKEKNDQLNKNIKTLRMINNGGLLPAIKEIAHAKFNNSIQERRALAYLKTYLYEVDFITAPEFYEDKYTIEEWREDDYIEDALMSTEWEIVIKDDEFNEDSKNEFHFIFDVGIDKRTKYNIDISAKIINDSAGNRFRNIEGMTDLLQPLGETEMEILFGLKIPIRKEDLNENKEAKIIIKLINLSQQSCKYSLYGQDILRYKKGIKKMNIYLHFKNAVHCIMEPKYDPRSGAIEILTEDSINKKLFKMEKWGKSKWGADDIFSESIEEQYVYHATLIEPKKPPFFYFEQDKENCIYKEP